MEGPEWTPGGIPPKIHSLEYSGNTSDTSIDTQAARTIRAVSVTADPEQGGAVASTSAGQDTHRVELTPLLGLTQEFAIQVEREIQKQVQERSRQIVQDILQRSANRIMPPTPSEAARASLSQCFQKALATPRTEPAPPLKQPRGQTKEESVQYSLADSFAGINPPPPGILKKSHSAHLARGRAARVWNGPQMKRREGVVHTHREKLSQSVAGPAVPNPLGTFLKLEAGNPTRPVLNPQVSRRFWHLRRSLNPW